MELYLCFRMRLHGVQADRFTFTFTDKRRKAPSCVSQRQLVPWTVVTETALPSDPRIEERERRQNAIITTITMFIHTPQRCVSSISWSVAAQGKGKSAPVHTMEVGLQERRRDTAPIIFVRETRKIRVAVLTSRPLYPRYVVTWRLKASHNLNEPFGGQKACYTCRKTNDSTIVQPVA